jgi:hypothetical protein
MIILFTTVAPHPMADELSSFGLPIREAIAISEVFSLVEQYPDAPILITSDVDLDRAKIIQRHHSTLHLKASATVRDVLWELSHVMPVTTKPV